MAILTFQDALQKIAAIDMTILARRDPVPRAVLLGQLFALPGNGTVAQVAQVIAKERMLDFQPFLSGSDLSLWPFAIGEHLAICHRGFGGVF